MMYEVRGETGLGVEAGGQPSRVSKRNALERGPGRRLQERDCRRRSLRHWGRQVGLLAWGLREASYPRANPEL